MYIEPPRQRIPKVPLDRRAYAFLIDYVTVWLITSLLGGSNFFLELLVFTIAWLGMRVLLVSVNQGQSLGRWALDLKVMDTRFRRLPSLVNLTKREAIVGFGAFLAMMGLNLAFINPFSTLILISPLLAESSMALTDEEMNQTLHDRLGQTIIIPTRRGFSLDVRLRRIYWEVKKSLNKRK
nr:RDD family protein [Gloeocapsa sp. PCC 73106]